MENSKLKAIYDAATGSKAKKLQSQKSAFEKLASMPKRPTVRAVLEAGVAVTVDDLIEIYDINRRYAIDIFAKIKSLDEVAICRNDDGAFSLY